MPQRASSEHRRREEPEPRCRVSPDEPWMVRGSSSYPCSLRRSLPPSGPRDHFARSVASWSVIARLWAVFEGDGHRPASVWVVPAPTFVPLPSSCLHLRPCEAAAAVFVPASESLLQRVGVSSDPVVVKKANGREVLAAGAAPVPLTHHAFQSAGTVTAHSEKSSFLHVSGRQSATMLKASFPNSSFTIRSVSTRTSPACLPRTRCRCCSAYSPVHR